MQEAPGDPFSLHFERVLPEQVVDVLKTNDKSTFSDSWNSVGRLQFQYVEVERNKSESLLTKDGNAFSDDFASVPKCIDNVDWDALAVKKQLHKSIATANKEGGQGLSTLQKEILSVIKDYRDLLYPERTLQNGEEIRFVYCLHALNHILKTRHRIVSNFAKLSSKKGETEEFRDQGLARPKVLVLLPFRESALRVVNILINLLVPKDEKGTIANKKKFADEFGSEDVEEPPNKKLKRPTEYEAIFSGNTDDAFRIGLSVTKKGMKLYTDFYSSDIIVASPLGLRTVIGAEGDKNRDFDFLNSIEMLILDQADIFLMQNWEHVLHIVQHLHLQPRESHGVDFSRVRMWTLNGWAKLYRQTMAFSSVQLPELNALFNRYCSNYAGLVKILNPVMQGSISQVVTQLPQMFHRFSADSPVDDAEARFKFFLKKILPQYHDSLMSHTLIYIPSYCDFVRLRNYFKKEEISIAQICEYSKDSKVSRARGLFFTGKRQFMLYTERFHFYRRYRIKGIRHLIFYQLPTYSNFYSEVANFMQENQQESNLSCSILCSKWDSARLAAVVGVERCRQILTSERDTHLFITGDDT